MLLDRHNRSFSYLRVSVTDRCNFRCVYCMPTEGVKLIPRQEVLSFEEIARLVRVGVALGLRKVRLTGGEPTVRADLPVLVRMLAAIHGIGELSMTTNASRLEELAVPLREAGLARVNVSLDTLRPERAHDIARRDMHASVLRGIDAAVAAGLTPMKLNAVVMRGVNDDELCDLVDFAHERGAEMRFIEYMPMGHARHDAHNQTVTAREMRRRLAERFELEPADVIADCGLRIADLHGGSKVTCETQRDESAHRPPLESRFREFNPQSAIRNPQSSAQSSPDPARPWVCRSTGARVGFITSISEHFCDTCSRMRLTAEGALRPCLHQDAEVDVRAVLRRGGSDAEVEACFQRAAALKWAGHRMTQLVPLYSRREMVAIGG